MLDRFFILDGHIPVNAARIHYQWPVVFLSYTIIVFAAFLALAVLRQINPGDRRSRSRGTLLGAAVLGTGIWSMHFTGMIALKMEMRHSYNFWLTALSLAVAFLFSFAVFRNATRARFTARTIVLNALLLGIGVASVHFVGMEAMQIDGSVSYRPALLALSVLIAIAASGAALAIMRFVANDTKSRAALQLAAALVLGVAVCGMHYAGMAAAVIVPCADCELNPPQSETELAIFVGITTLIIFGLSIILLIQGFLKPSDKHKSSAKWHYIYFILAVFDILTAGVSVYISDLLYETYDDATAIRRTWIGYRDEIVKTGFAAHAINRSGNDVLKNHDVEGERKKFYSALEDYSTRVLRVKASVMASSASLERNGQFNPLIKRLNDSFDAILQITPKIKEAAESVFQMESSGDAQDAFLAMQDMDQIFSEQSKHILLLDDTIGQINVSLLNSLGIVTKRIRYYEYIVMLLMVIMVCAATIYGFRLAKKAKNEEKLEERRRQVN